MLRTSLLLTLITSVLCSSISTARMGPNTPFAFHANLCENYQSVTIGDVSVPKGTTSAPCEMGRSCWQQLTDRQFAVLSPSDNDKTGIIVVYPMDERKSPSAIIVRGKKDSSIEPSVPGGVGLITTIKPPYDLHDLIFLLYMENIRDTELIGNIQFGDINAVVEEVKGKEIMLLTGRTGTEMMEYNFTCSDGRSSLFRIDITAGVSAPFTIEHVAFSGAYIWKPWKFLLLLLAAIAISANT